MGLVDAIAIWEGVMPTTDERLTALEAQAADAIEVQHKIVCLLYMLAVNGKLPKGAVKELMDEVGC